MKFLARFVIFLVFCFLTACLPKESYSGTPSATTGQAPNLPGSELCDIGALTPSAQWQRKLNKIHLTLTLLNYTPARCQITGQPNVWVEDKSGFLYSQTQELIDPTEGEASAYWLETGGGNGVRLEISWENWCGPLPQDGLRLVMLLGENPGRVDTIIQDPGGQPLVDTPECENSQEKSIIRIGSFQLVNP